MIIGIPGECKPFENRVAMTPDGVRAAKHHGHVVLLQRGAGRGSGFDDEIYRQCGAELVDSIVDVYLHADMVVHVKEPQRSEFRLIRPGQIILTYIHAAADEELTNALMASACVGIAYETIRDPDGSLPLLKPMSEVAGCMAALEAAKYLQSHFGGSGVLMCGTTYAEPATVLVIGGGIAGYHAALMAHRLGAKVRILESDDRRMGQLRELSAIMMPGCLVERSTEESIITGLATVDAVIGAVLVAGAKAPKVITRDMLKYMKRGAVLVDVAVDQGGCFETTHPTTHDDPVYVVDGIVHYAVANMPSAYARTSTLALTKATLPYVLEIADKGWRVAVRANPAIRHGLNFACCRVTHPKVAEAFGLRCIDIDRVL